MFSFLKALEEKAIIIQSSEKISAYFRCYFMYDSNKTYIDFCSSYIKLPAYPDLLDLTVFFYLHLKGILQLFIFIFFKGGLFFVLYSTLFHLPLLRFHCVGGCWDRRTKFATSALTVRRSNHSAKSHPQAKSHPHFTDFTRLRNCC